MKKIIILVLFIFFFLKMTQHYRTSVIFFLMAWSATQLVILSIVAGNVSSGEDQQVSKADFLTLECKGIYNQTNFEILNKICKECANRLDTNELYILCRLQ